MRDEWRRKSAPFSLLGGGRQAGAKAQQTIRERAQHARHDIQYSTAQAAQHSTDRQTVKSNESMELLVVDHCDDQQ